MYSIQYSFLTDIQPIVTNYDFTEYVKKNFKGCIQKQERSIFVGSEFEEILELHSHARGGFGEKLIKKFAQDLGFSVTKSKEGDTKLSGIDTEIKSARQREDGGFTINQIRPQNYKYVVIFFLLPKEGMIATVPKNIMISLSTGQHGGNSATETFIYNAKDTDTIFRDLGSFIAVDVFRNTFSLLQEA